MTSKLTREQLSKMKIFNCTDSDKRERGPVEVEVLRKLGSDECDAEVGDMYAVRLPDGSVEHAFSDELSVIG